VASLLLRARRAQRSSAVSAKAKVPCSILAHKTVHTFGDKPGYFSISVPAGEDGKLWSFEHCAGNRFLMTVPPCLARDASELLLPEEVVLKDAPR